MAFSPLGDAHYETDHQTPGGDEAGLLVRQGTYVVAPQIVSESWRGRFGITKGESANRVERSWVVGPNSVARGVVESALTTHSAEADTIIDSIRQESNDRSVNVTRDLVATSPDTPVLWEHHPPATSALYPHPLSIDSPHGTTLIDDPATGGVSAEAGMEWNEAVNGDVDGLVKPTDGADQFAPATKDGSHSKLRAGDVNHDFHFDEADLIQMFQTGKYERDVAATWDEGDFAGGSSGAPDGVFDSTDLVYAFQAEIYTNGSYNRAVAARPVHGRVSLKAFGTADLVLTYVAADGTIKIEGSETIFSTFHLHSTDGIFTGPASNQNGVYDVATASSLFHLATDGTSALSYPAIARPQLSRDEVLKDLTIDGSRLEGGPLGTVVLNYVSDTPGDVTGDRQLDVQDIDLLCQQVRYQSATPAADLNQDGQLNESDLAVLIEEIFGTKKGDANLDGVVDSSDLVLAFQSGSYEDADTGNSSWQDGDWDCSGDFESTDFVFAFQGGYAASVR